MWEVNLREDEYSKFQKKLVDYHNGEMASIKAAVKDMKQILENGSSFHLEQTTKNLLSVINIIEGNILPLMEDDFDNSEQYVNTIIASFNNIDTLC